jgi:hypothetical protein
VLIFLAVVLWLFWLKHKLKWLAIWGIILWILALLTSPSFWLLVASNNLNNNSKQNNKVIEETSSSSNDKKLTSLTTDENIFWTSDKVEKKSPRVFVKQEDWKLNLFTQTMITDRKKENYSKQYWVEVSDIKVTYTDNFETLKLVAMADSDETLKAKIEDFYNWLSEKDKELTYDSYWDWVYKFNISIDYIAKHKDAIKKLYEYKGFMVYMNENKWIKLN